MIIGVPKEIKPDENRVSLPPDKVEVLVTAVSYTHLRAHET